MNAARGDVLTVNGIPKVAEDGVTLHRHSYDIHEPLPQRKKLQLKPRSLNAGRPSGRRTRSHSSTAGSDIFGTARPREEVLKNRGIDAQILDSRFEKKAQITRFEPDQDVKIEAVRTELTAAEQALREANERELPEESHRVKVEAKRKELRDLINKFTLQNETAKGTTRSTKRKDINISHN